MNPDQLMMMQLFGGGIMGTGAAWTKCIFLAFLLLVPILRPHQIRILSMFRRACTCFGLSLILPGIANIVLTTAIVQGAAGTPYGAVPSSGALGMTLLRVLSGAGPVLFGLSVIFALRAVVPGFIPPAPIHPPGTPRPPSSSNDHRPLSAGPASAEDSTL